MPETNKTPQELKEEFGQSENNEEEQGEQKKGNGSNLFSERLQAELNDPDCIKIKRKTDFYVEKSEKYLKNMFGQTNLSNIEKARLREIAEQCIRQKLEETISVYKGEMRAENCISVENEIIYRWLWELWDIKKSDIPGRPYGNQVLDVPEDFKEYLRRLREKSHLL